MTITMGFHYIHITMICLESLLFDDNLCSIRTTPYFVYGDHVQPVLTEGCILMLTSFAGVLQTTRGCHSGCDDIEFISRWEFSLVPNSLANWHYFSAIDLH